MDTPLRPWSDTATVIYRPGSFWRITRGGVKAPFGTSFAPYHGAPAGDVHLYVKTSVFPGCFANGLPASQAAILDDVVGGADHVPRWARGGGQGATLADRSSSPAASKRPRRLRSVTSASAMDP